MLKLESLSNCCGVKFTAPGWSESDLCSKCKEHADIEKLSRDEVQEEVISEWVLNAYRGIAVCATGFGKTHLGKLAIEKLNQPNTIVVVPTLELKSQWELKLKQWKLVNTKVVVINTASTNQFECDLLILDECHRVPAKEFRKLFDTIKFKYLLGLTATLQRQDGEEKILSEYPVICDISLDTCVENGWISPFVVYNLEVDFTPNERLQYKKAENSFKYAALQCGFGSQAFKNAQQWLKSGTTQQKGFAGMYFNSMRKRKELILNSSNKPLVVKQIVDLFPDRTTIVFNETIESAEEINKLLGDESVVFHSKLKKSEKEETLRLFKDRRNKKRVLSSVKALQEGVDYPHCSLGIIPNGTSVKRSGIQITGRIVRFVEGKRAIIVNLYIKDSQDFFWCRTRTKEQNPIWIKKLEEIV